MKKFEMMLSILMVLIIIFISVVPVLAEDIKVITSETPIDNKFFTEDNNYIVADEVVETPINNDKKKICKAVIDDDFDSNSVLVVLKNEDSLDFNNCDSLDFSSINPKSIREITESTSNIIMNEFETKKTEYATNLKEIITSNNIVPSSEIATIAGINITGMNDKVIKEKAEAIAKAEIKDNYAGFHKIMHIELGASNKQVVLDAIKELEKNEKILAAEPNYYWHLDETVINDTYGEQQWALEDAFIKSAWDITTGSSSVKVGIIDDGIDINHPDLAGNIDTSLGKSFTDASPHISVDGHGTKVAGIIGAVGNNSRGIAGVCWDVSLVSLQVCFNNNEIYLSEIASAVQYAGEKGIQIINLSCSSSVKEHSAFEAALKTYDGIICCSAGKQGADIDSTLENAERSYPSILDSYKIVSVAAMKDNYDLHSESNYGEVSIDLAAPGNMLYTTVGSDSYGWVHGTSFATPYVTGVVALIKSKYPNITTLGIRRAILSNVDMKDSLLGLVQTGGKLNAYKAISSISDHKFTVIYDKNGGGGTMNSTLCTYGFYKNLSKCSFGKTGYIFKGWDACRSSDKMHRYIKDGEEKWFVEGTETTGYSKCLYEDEAAIAHTSPVKDDKVTMIAQWDPITYNITFDKNGGGASMNALACVYGLSYTLAFYPSGRAGYTFGGWRAYKYDNDVVLWLHSSGKTYNWYAEDNVPIGYNIVTFENGATFSNITRNNGDEINFVAQWIPNSYIINYDSNGGAGNMQHTVGFTNDNVQLSSNRFNRDHCRFIGWNIIDNYGCWSTTYDDEWLAEIPTGYDKKMYVDSSYVNYIAEYVGDELIAIAQWFLLGDVDLDGVVSIMDSTLMQSYFAGNIILTNEQISHGDFNEDGYFDMIDATAIQMYLISTN